MESESSEKVVLSVMEAMLKAGLRSVREQLSSMGKEERGGIPEYVFHDFSVRLSFLSAAAPFLLPH